LVAAFSETTNNGVPAAALALDGQRCGDLRLGPVELDEINGLVERRLVIERKEEG
jgi:hypothetical protein